VGLFGRPVPRGSWAAWAGGPQALSPVAATTCRVRMAAWVARRGSAKVRLYGTSTAKFQHLYTRLTWRFSGWSARDIVSCESSAFILRPSSFVGAAVALRARATSPRCAGWSGILTHPGARGPPVPSARLLCAMARAVDRGPEARCRRMPQQGADLWSMFFLIQRNPLCVGDVRR